MAKKTPPKKPKIEQYEASITLMGKVSTNKAKTIAEAISGLSVGNAKGVGIMVLKHGDKKKEKILNPNQTFRLFHSNGIVKEIVVKNISSLFEGI